MAADMERIGTAVQQRRQELGLSAAALAAAAGISATTMSKVENGGGAQPSTLARISVALGWPRDALALVGAGAPPPDPVVRTIPVPVDVLEEVRAEMRALRRAVEALEAREGGL